MTSIIMHIVIPAGDNEEAKDFYANLFPNWRYKSLPPNEFWEVTDENGEYPHTAYLALMKGEGTPPRPTIYYRIDDIDIYIEKAIALGGSVIVPVTPVPGVGYYAGLLDVLGNDFGLWEDDPSVGEDEES